MQFNEVKDSGEREKFSTGSQRDTRDGKGRFDLMSPIVAERDARHLENGARKYGDRNWEKGQQLSRFLDSAIRHLNKYHEGHRDEDHLAAARWNIAGIIHTEEMISRGLLPAELNDLPNYVKKAPALTISLPRPYERYFRVRRPNKAGYVSDLLGWGWDGETGWWVYADSREESGFGLLDFVNDADFVEVTP